MSKFRQIWAGFDPDGTGFMPKQNLPDLLFGLGDPLGWNDEYLFNETKQNTFIDEL